MRGTKEELNKALLERYKPYKRTDPLKLGEYYFLTENCSYRDQLAPMQSGPGVLFHLKCIEANTEFKTLEFTVEHIAVEII